MSTERRHAVSYQVRDVRDQVQDALEKIQAVAFMVLHRYGHESKEERAFGGYWQILDEAVDEIRLAIQTEGELPPAGDDSLFKAFLLARACLGLADGELENATGLPEREIRQRVYDDLKADVDRAGARRGLSPDQATARGQELFDGVVAAAQSEAERGES